MTKSKKNILPKRLLIILLWVVILIGALYLPSALFWKKKSSPILNVFGWAEMFPLEDIKIFEKETGIKVHLHYYTTNEELLAKLKALKGKGYDLIMPSDYAVYLLIEEGLIKPLDHSKLSFFPKLNPMLMGREYDPTNRYSIPYQWEVFGYGIDLHTFPNPSLEGSWDYIFKKEQIDYRIIMVDDPIEAFSLASQYLFGPVDSLTKQQITQVEDLLREQKSVVEAYSTLRGDYFLLTKNCQLALCWSSCLFRSAEKYSHIKVVLPKEWNFITIENMCIPIGSEKEELVYRFLHFLYDKKQMGKACSVFLNFPATVDAFSYLEGPKEFLDFLKASENSSEPFYFIKEVASEKEMRNAWIKARS